MESDHLWHRRSSRLPEYDYSQTGAYFITLVAHRRQLLLGEIKDSELHLNDLGQIVLDVWTSLPARYPQVARGTAVVMPNPFHGIVIIHESPVAMPVGAIHESFPPVSSQPASSQPESPVRERRAEHRRMTLPLVVGYFKMNSAKRINEALGLSGIPVWQRNYYEHIIRDDEEHNRFHLYIESNIANWTADDENSLCQGDP